MKNVIKPLFLFLFTLFFVQFLSAQTKIISGVVTDSDGVPLPGVNISVRGATVGTSTDFDGNYQIEAEEGQTLVFSYVGFDDQSMKVGSDSTLNVQMTEGQALEEVVVSVGYGSQRTRDNTSAVSSVKASDITRTSATTDATKALQGKIAGVQVRATDQPGKSPSINIRGMGTVLGGRDPLYVVDGMFMSNIDNINPHDIESIDVLKDASALAVYGNRAANGAIIVTTKTGKRDMIVEYDGSFGIRSPLKKVKMANSAEYVRYSNLAEGGNRFSENQPYDTDWFDAIIQQDMYNEHNLSISGSSDKVRYLFSMNNYNERGLQKRTNFNRTTMRSNNEFKISDFFTLTQTLNMGYTKESPRINATNTYDPFTVAYRQSPIIPTRFEDGSYGGPVIDGNGVPSPTGGSAINNVANPYADIMRSNEKEQKLRLQGGLKLKVDFNSIISGLTFNSQFNGDYLYQKHYTYDNGQRVVGQENVPSFDNQLTNLNQDFFNWVFSNYFNFNHGFGDHHVNLMAGVELSEDSGLNIVEYERQNVESNQNYWHLDGVNYADNTTILNSIHHNREKTFSYFGRLQYQFKRRYLITGTLRRDGSSQFTSGNRWGTFPSFGVGWILSEEDFLVNSAVIDNLKIRGGWGRLGNKNIPLNIATFASGANYQYAFNGLANSSGRTIDQVIDPNLSWEITEEMSAGIDYSLFNHKLQGSIDLYSKKTNNIILESKPVSTAGISNPGYAHMGSVLNRGFEVSVGWADDITTDFSYGINVNYSYNKNELSNVGGKNFNIINGGQLDPGQFTKYFGKRAVGYPLGSFYLWQTDGFDDNGEFKYKDTNGNGKTGEEDGDDRVFMGSYIPKQNLGISLNLSYKNWDLVMDGYGSFGNKVFNGLLANRYSNENIPKDVANNYWTPDHTNAKHPAPNNNVPTPSSYFLESGDYFRVNTIELGYNLQNPIEFISSLRAYLNVANPFIIQKYSGYNPEPNVDADPYGLAGIEQFAYPTLRSFTLGLSIKF